MTDSQALWHVDSHHALTLAGQSQPRRLAVERGRVWLTLAGEADAPASDQWLEAGEALTLAPGQSAVIEGWPAADFALMVPPVSAAPRAGLLRRLGRLGVRRA